MRAFFTFSRWRLFPRLALTVTVFAIAGCYPTTIVSRYAPLHPANGTSVEIAFRAYDRDGVTKVSLYVYERELYVADNGMRSARRRDGGTWGHVQTWEYPAEPRSVEEVFDVGGFPASSSVEFIVKTTDGKGHEATDSWSFAAGTWPFGNAPIPLWVNGPPAERIDVAFVADWDDYATARDMLPDLEGLVFDGYHVNNGVKKGKKYWEFFYSPERGHITDYDATPREMDIPASVSGSAIIDHAAVIHTTVKRDWASGGNFGTEPTHIGTAVHESGHSAFGLADEYDGGVHWSSSDPHHNTYDTKTKCENYNSSMGLPTSD